MTYEEIRVDLCDRYPGLRPTDVDEMSFEQIGSLCREGKAAGEGIEVGSIEQAIEVAEDYARNWRHYHGV